MAPLQRSIAEGLLSAVALLCITAPAGATPKGEAEAAVAEAGAKQGEGADPSREETAAIVVRARRGEALVAAETELAEGDIGMYGADSIQQLLERIAPEIDGTGDPPELVINGKRVDPAGLQAFPPEALARLAILAPEAAARYGFDPGKRVVNLVLKENYASWNAIASAVTATRGGRLGGRLNAGRFLIAGDLRWNAQGAVSHDSHLLKSDRDVPMEPQDEWAVAAGLHPHRYETLLPSSTSLSFNTGITHPLGDFSGTAHLNATAAEGESLLGLAPSGPVSGHVRPDPLRSTQSARTVSARASLSGSIADWRTNASLSFTQTWSENRFDRASSSDADLGRLTERTDGINRSLAAQVDARRDVFPLPAGPAGLVLDLRADTSTSSTTRISADRPTADFEATRQRASARAALSLPVASRALETLQPLGDLSVELGATAEAVPETPLRWSWSAGSTWTPVEPLRLRASYEYEQQLPTLEELNAPLIETLNRVFDFARQEVAETIWITGGNPALEEGSRQRLAVEAMIRPLGSRLLTLNLNYRRDHKTGGIAALPELTPTVEAAFPGRFHRDAEGRLIAIDARPINIESETSAQLTSGVTIRWAGSGEHPTRLSLTLSYRWRLEDVVVAGKGVAPLDRLKEAGMPRHSANMQIVAARSGLGLTLSGTWTGAARVGSGLDYRYAPAALFNLEVYAEPEHLWAGQAGWAENLKISLDVQNLLAGYRRVTIDGASAPGFERDLIDPLGRTIRLTATKRF